MEQLLNMFVQSPVAGGAGAVGMLCFAVYPMFRSRRLLLVIDLGNSVIPSARTLVATGLVRWPGLRWVYYTLMPLLGAAGVTWRGCPSLHCASAAVRSTFGRMQRNEVTLRALMLGSAHV